MKTLSLAKLFAPSVLVLALAACGGSSGGDTDNNTGGSTPPPSGSTPPPSNATPPGGDIGDDGNEGGSGSLPGTGLSFNIAGSTALQALSSGVAADASAQLMSSDGSRTLAGFSDANELALSLLEEGEISAVTNLLAVDEDGNTVLAIDSKWPALVEYSAMHPDGEYVYIALSAEYQSIDYGQIVWQTDCGIYKVSLEDSSYSCVAEGLLVSPMSDNNLRSISNNSKPMIFDEQGTVYFAARGYETECYEDGYCWGNYNWGESIVYSVTSEGELRAITNDLQNIQNFQVLGDGRIVYYGYNEASSRNELSIFNDPGTALLSESWGVEFYTVDQDQTVMFADNNASGIRFAKPRESGGVLRTTLNTSIFGQDEDGNSSGRPVRILEADNGRIYGVFNSGYWREDTEGTNGRWVEELSVYQILPYDPSPKTSVELPDGRHYWDTFGRVPFQVNKGFLYHTARETVPFHGEVDVIRMVNLNTGDVSTLLNDNLDEQRLVIHNWRLSGDTLYFSGQNNANTTSVFGEIDTLAVRDGEDDVLTLREVASARGAAMEVRDIEILRPRQPVVDTGGSPEGRVFMDPENRYSVSVDFSKYMNRASVLNNLSLEDAAGSKVDLMPVWYYQSLHLIPDTSSLGLAGSESSPLKHETTYNLNISNRARDAWDWDFVGLNESMTTLPAEGWLVREVRENQKVDHVLSGHYASYLGTLREGSDWDFQRARFGVRSEDGLAVEVPSNFSIEFSSRQQSWNGFSIDVVEVMEDTENGRAEGKRDNVIHLNMRDYLNVEYRYDSPHGWTNRGWAEMDRYRNVFSQEWRRYRLTLINGELRLYVARDGENFEFESFSRWDGQQDDYIDVTIDDVGAFDRDHAVYTLELRTEGPMVLDNLVVRALDSNGQVADTLFENDFDSTTTEQLRSIFGEQLLWTDTVFAEPKLD